MKRILTGMMIIAGLAGAQDYVLATKLDPGYVVPQATMPYSLWTNSVFWLTAESPVLDEGTTNANWLCYAKTCAGNATQTTVASQPDTITTNGVKALSFDGDDLLLSPTQAAYSGTNDWTLSFWMNIAAWPAGSASMYTCSLYDTLDDQRSWGINFRGPSAAAQANVMCLIYSADGIASGISVNSRVLRADVETGWKHVVHVTSGGGNSSRFYVNGVGYTEAVIPIRPLFASTAQFSVGGIALGGTFNGLLDDIRMISGALSSNDVVNIYNATKGRYGL